MNATHKSPDTMSKPLSPAAESAMLSHFPWTPEGKIRLSCTLRTEPLLRKAGVRDPKPLESYDVPVRRMENGFLAINPYHRSAVRPPIENSNESLFETGGIFANDSAPEEADQINLLKRAFPLHAMPDSARAELSALCEIPCTRTFEIPTGPQSKIRVQVIAFDDEALPSPNERECWKPSKPTNTQIHAAVYALYLSRRLADLEQL